MGVIYKEKVGEVAYKIILVRLTATSVAAKPSRGGGGGGGREVMIRISPVKIIIIITKNK